MLVYTYTKYWLGEMIMKYDTLYLSINSVIEYIEENLKNQITLDQISDHVHISKFYLNRIFSALSKTSLMSYVKNRKLSSSVHELLWTNLRISDISQEYGFDYDQTYIRAFKNIFGISPDRFRKEKTILKIKDKINIDYIREIGENGIALEPPIFIIPEFYIAGFRHKLYSKEDRMYHVANSLGNDFFDHHRHKIVNAVNPDTYIGFVEYSLEDLSHCYYSPSLQVSAHEDVPNDMVVQKVPTHKYAAFKYIGLHHPSQIGITNLLPTLNYINEDWLPKSGYRRCAPYHFEKIDGKDTRDDYCELELFIPIMTI